MPRHDQVVRQWHLLQHLQTSRYGLTLKQLQEQLPSDYARHARTIRRDLEALSLSNFPLLTERSDGQVRWRLMEEFRNAPALAFAPTELMALAFSRHLLTPLQGTEVQSALDSALAKVSAGIPPHAMAFVQQLQSIFSVGLGPHKSYKQHRSTIDTLTQAIAQKRTVQMHYDSASRNETRRREVDPYCLRYVGGALYLIAYCHWRRDVRMFAVERIRSLTPTNHPYQMPLHFDVDAYVEDALVVMRGERIEVDLLFDKATAAWVKDRVWHPSQKLTPLRGGRLRMVLMVADTRELLGWVLSFGSGVQVIRPEPLRSAVKEEAQRMLGRA